MKKVTLILAIIVMLALTSCGGGDDDTSGSGSSGGSQSSISVIMNDIYFGETNDNIANPPSWSVNAGDSVTVQADNKGVLEHNWAIVKADATLPDTIADPAAVADMILFDMGGILGGDTGSKTFTAPAAGEYTVICTIAGHYPVMQGKLVVGE
ncbi:MAG: hypothetical protein H6658_03020 [Ardenticatenaceae bacterium]|nr:hypothetical protein [Ardenticatenaceae bacterium]